MSPLLSYIDNECPSSGGRNTGRDEISIARNAIRVFWSIEASWTRTYSRITES